MTAYRITTPTSVFIIDASDPGRALEYLGERLRFQNKPWLWRDLPIREATDTELQQWTSAGQRVVRAPERKDPTKR